MPVTDVPQKYYVKGPVTAVQITEETFEGAHPNSRHLMGVIYDPVAKTATINGHVAHCGDWIVFNGCYWVATDREFNQQFCPGT